MINKWCHCKQCGKDWEEQDVRVESLGYQPQPEEVIRCSKCGKKIKS